MEKFQYKELLSSTKLNLMVDELNSNINNLDTLSEKIGDLNLLQTLEKNSLVDSINEAATKSCLTPEQKANVDKIPTIEANQTTVNEIKEVMESLPDGSAVSALVSLNTEKLSELENGGERIITNAIQEAIIAENASINKNTSILGTATTTNVVYFPIKKDATYHIHIPHSCGTSKLVYAYAKELYNKEAEANYVYRPTPEMSGVNSELDLELTFDAYLTDEQGYNYVVVSYYTTKGIPTTIEKSTSKLNGLVNTEKTVKDNTARIEKLEGKGGDVALRVTADTVTNGQIITLDDFPQSNKVGNQYAVHAYVETFGKLCICQGYKGNYDYPNYWFEIDNENVTLFSCKKSVVEKKEQYPHGLSISAFISVNVNIDDDEKARVIVSSIGGTFEKMFENWSSAASGMAQVVSEGSVLKNVTYSATNNHFRCPLWIFGASQEGFGSYRYIGQLREMGYKNYLVNAYGGRTSATMLADLKRALKFGCPKYVYFGLSNDGYDYDIYKPRMDAAKALADEYGFEIIFVTKFVSPAAITDELKAQYLEKRNCVINYGCRYWDFGNAVSSDPTNADAIYTGYLDDVYVHPKTVQAAKALALSFMADVPEVMQQNNS